MTPEDWQRVKPILDSALQLDSTSRPAFLKQACAEPSLRHEIESMIAAHEQAGTGALKSAAFLRSTLPAGTRLGDFQILSLLGSGGIQRYWLPRIYARLSLAAKKPTEAVEQVRVAEPMEARSCNYSYDRGEVYLEAHQGAAAAAAFRQIIDHPGLAENCLPSALARLQVGRAYVMQGDAAKAKAAYQDFLALWKDADPDIPILKEAKAEYAKLQ